MQAAAKTNDTAGDGTTTATILAAAIIAEGMKIVAAGTNPIQLSRGIETTVNELVKELAKMSVEVTDDDLANVATVSAGNNEVVSHWLFGCTSAARWSDPCRYEAKVELSNRWILQPGWPPPWSALGWVVPLRKAWGEQPGGKAARLQQAV